MSRRIIFFVLAASAALNATPASADPECFREGCRTPEVIEPPPPVQESPDAYDAATPQARNAASNLAEKALPALVVEAARREAVLPVQYVADEASVPPLAPRPVKSLPASNRVPVAAALAPVPETNTAPAGYVRGARVSSPDSGYVVGSDGAPIGGIVVIAPSAVYGSGRYLIAPSAKIISIDRDE
jgi:hypothetical protein